MKKGERITLALTRLGRTVAKMASAIKEKDPTIRRMMREDRLDPDLTQKIADYLSVSPEWLQTGMDFDAPEWAKLPPANAQEINYALAAENAGLRAQIKALKERASGLIGSESLVVSLSKSTTHSNADLPFSGGHEGEQLPDSHQASSPLHPRPRLGDGA